MSAVLDPIPGSPDTIRSGGGEYTRTATALSEAARTIRALAARTSGQSDAVTALLDTADDVAGRLDRLQGRYATAGSTLTTYADELADAQRRANAAGQTHAAAAASLDRAQDHYDSYHDQARSTSDPTAAQEAAENARAWSWQVREHATQMDQARAAYDSARADADAAGDRAATAIAQAIDHDGINDSGWDNFTGWVSEHADVLKVIKDVLSGIATVLAIAAIFFPVLLPFAAVAAGLAAVVSLTLALSGEISWVEFGLDALAAVTLGVGAMASRGLKVTMTALKSGRTARAFKEVTGKMTRAQKNRIGARRVQAEWDSLKKAALEPGTTRWSQAMWARRLKSHKSFDNLVYGKILKEGTVGVANSAKDAALVAKANLQLGLVRFPPIAGAVLGLPSKVDDAAGKALQGLDLFEKVTSVNTDALSGSVEKIRKTYDRVVEQTTTHRVGSNW